MNKFTEYAIIKANIDELPETEAEVIIKSKKVTDIIIYLNKLELDDEDMTGYTVEEYKVDADGEFVEGSDYDTADNFRSRHLPGWSKPVSADFMGVKNEADEDLN